MPDEQNEQGVVEDPIPVKTGFWARLGPAKQKKLRDAAVEMFIFGTIIALFSLFISLRGATGMLASRVTLFFLFLAGVFFLVMVPELIEDLTGKPSKHTKTLLGLGICVLLVGVVFLDRWAPRPLTLSDLPPEYGNAFYHRITGTASFPAYADGTMIAGVPWKSGSMLITLKLAPDKYISNIHLKFEYNVAIIHAAQVTNVPNIQIEPQHRDLLSNFEAGYTDKDGNVHRMSATPSDEQNINNYPNNTFIFEASNISPDIPVELAFVSGTGYQLGNFTFVVPSQPHVLDRTHVSGKYDIVYKDHTFTVPVDLHMDRTP